MSRACRHCDRAEDQIAACPSVQSCACSALLVHKAAVGIGKLAERYDREIKASGNYVANKEVNPTRVTFANGRVVRIVRDHLVVEWAKPKKAQEPK